MEATSFTQQDWEHYAMCYDRLNELTPYRAMLDEVLSVLTPLHAATVLDAACGTGNFITRALGDPSQQASVSTFIGCDYSTVMLERARSKLPPEALVLRADLNRPLPFPVQHVDVIISINTIYAIEDPAELIARFAQLLTTNGTLILVTPNAGYQNGLILKEHCGSTKPDAYWEHVHLSPEIEEARIREACPDPELAADLIHVGRFNRLICANHRFHFFDKGGLDNIITAAGLEISDHRMTYAGQCHLVIAHKS